MKFKQIKFHYFRKIAGKRVSAMTMAEFRCGTHAFVGLAFCSVDDQFSRETGREVAQERLLDGVFKYLRRQSAYGHLSGLYENSRIKNLIEQIRQGKITTAAGVLAELDLQFKPYMPQVFDEYADRLRARIVDAAGKVIAELTPANATGDGILSTSTDAGGPDYSALAAVLTVSAEERTNPFRSEQVPASTRD